MRWLLHRRPFLATLPTVGITVSDMFVSVCISGPPVRLTGVYRSRLESPDGADRRAAVLAAAMEARRVLRTPLGTPAVLALGPVGHTVHMPLADGWGRRRLTVTPDVDVAHALERAGFAVDRFDALPVALARFALCTTKHQHHLRAGGWEVSVSAEALTAEANADRWTENQDPAGAQLSAVPDLPGVRLPDVVRRHLLTDLDAGAIGAALRGFWFHPDLLVDTPSTPVSMRVTPERSAR